MHPRKSRSAPAATLPRGSELARRWAVSDAWSSWRSAPGVLVRAYEAIEGRSDWHSAAEAAVAKGAAGDDAALLADALEVSLSENRTREAWIVSVSAVAEQAAGGNGREAAEWLIDADLTVDAALGCRIAAEAAARCLAAMPALQQARAAAGLLVGLYAAVRPLPELALRATAGCGGFVHRGRCYVLSSARCLPVSSVCAVSASGAVAAYRRHPVDGFARS